MPGLPLFRTGSSSARGRVFAAGVACLLLIGALIGADLLIAARNTAGASAEPSNSAQASSDRSLGTATPTTGPATSAWTSINFARVASPPFGKASTGNPSVVAWQGGYLAVGYSRDVEGQDGTFRGWTSRDATSWQLIPDATFLPGVGAASAAAAPCGAVIVANGPDTAAYETTDGTSWTKTQSLTDGFSNYPPRLAGNDAGAAVVLGGAWGQTTLWFASECRTWKQVTLPQAPGGAVAPTGVTAVRGGFLVYGALSPKNPAAATFGAAWWSADGVTWTAAPMPASPSLIYGGSGGAFATLEAQFQPGMDTNEWATSADGAAWQVAATTPAFVPSLGQAASDGSHIVVMGSTDSNAPFGLWSSTDGTQWQSLVVRGDPAAMDGIEGALDFFVLPGGVLRISDTGVWYGAAGSGPVPTATSGVATSVPSLGGTVPPVSSATWKNLAVRQLNDGPAGATGVASWAGGYVAVRDADASSAAAIAWVSRDGVSWLRLPPASFGSATRLIAGRCRDGVIVAGGDAAGETWAWQSSDGLTWQKSTAPPLKIEAQSLAGNANGAIAITADGNVAVTADCSSWRTVDLPAGSAAEVGPVAASAGTYFISGCPALANVTRGATPPAAGSWWSTDGQKWNAATGSDCLPAVAVGKGGFVAETRALGTPGTTGFVGSADAHNWTAYADPLGYWSEGEGSGSANGQFVGDGTRILGYGNPHQSQVSGYWISFDGRHWTELRLSGDTAGLPDDVTPILLRDGVLLVGQNATWFGQAAGV